MKNNNIIIREREVVLSFHKSSIIRDVFACKYVLCVVLWCVVPQKSNKNK
jgi:hypothetical protein